MDEDRCCFRCRLEDLDYGRVDEGQITCTVCPRIWVLSEDEDGKPKGWRMTVRREEPLW